MLGESKAGRDEKPRSISGLHVSERKFGVERIRGDQEAERYARAFYQTSGDLTRPLVALHSTLDPIVPFEHELIYTALVKLRHKSRFFNLLPVRRYGHCNFTSDEIFNAFGLMLKQAARQTQR